MNDFDDPVDSVPKYCDFFKYLLVEELVLEPDYRQIHYGKSAIIGRLCAIQDNFKLENVTVSDLPSVCKLPTSSVSLLLLNFTNDNTGVENLVHGNYCIVRGEILLANVKEPNSPTLTTRGLHEQLLQLEDNEETRLTFLEQVQKNYRPALSVWHMNYIDQAEELLQRRLEMRVLCTARQ